MKLDKCALCGKSPEEVDGFVGCRAAYHDCPMVGVWRGLSADEWNRLQRAIRAKLRKSEPAGRVLVREWWCPCCQQVSTELRRNQRTCSYHDVPLVRVEVREAKGGRA